MKEKKNFFTIFLFELNEHQYLKTPKRLLHWKFFQSLSFGEFFWKGGFVNKLEAINICFSLPYLSYIIIFEIE